MAPGFANVLICADPQGNGTVITLVGGKRPLAIWDELMDTVVDFVKNTY